MLEELYRTTDEALNHRPRHDGFLGEELSDAERRVLDLLVDGRSVSDAARELWLSPNTVKTHRRSIYRKLGATTREEMVERVTEDHLLKEGRDERSFGRRRRARRRSAYKRPRFQARPRRCRSDSPSVHD